MDYEKNISIVKANYKTKDDIINIVKLLKEAGAGYIDSIWAIAHVGNLTIGEVEEIQINSPSYIGEKDRIIENRNIILDAWFSDKPKKDDETTDEDDNKWIRIK